MDSGTARGLKRATCIVDIAFAVIVFLYAVFLIFPWEGGPRVAVFLIGITSGYALVHLGAILSRSLLRRIFWMVPALVADLLFLHFAAWLLGGFSSGADLVLGGILAALVTLNGITLCHL